jgi:hypothetical protein
LHGTSYGKNAADAFIADNGWERGAQWIDALCDQEVTEVDRRKFDANKDLARAGSVRLGNVGVFKTVDGVAISG